jgi:glycosyltransferase involved in cell wall biosynthesis
MKVALVHDWLVTYRGGEKVLEAIAELFPGAPIFTLFHKRGSQSPALEARRIVSSPLDRIPFARERHRHFLPAMPAAIRAIDLAGFDLVVSSSHCVAKGARAPEGAVHVSYVHAPMRYMWDRFGDYFGPGRSPWYVRVAARAVRPWLQRWDRKSAAGVRRFAANSRNVAEQISRLWGREADVIHPPVDLDRFARVPLEGGGRGGYFLWLGALAPYKRLDVAVAAFREVGAPLWVAGSGQERAADLPPNVKLLGQVPDQDLPELLRGARALVFPGEEDFGITPLEAQACGRPVIAYARGGVLETTDERTALYFREQTPSALAAAVRRFDGFEAGFQPATARRNAERFGRGAFQAAFRRFVEAALGQPVCATAPLV